MKVALNLVLTQTLLCLSSLFINHVNAQNVSTTLRLVQLVTRHGDRTPLNVLPGDPQRDYWQQTGLGRMSNKGKKQMFELGVFLRHRYQTFINEILVPDSVYARSTDKDRTIQSALTLLAGWFPPVGDQIWNPDLLWLPIPVHTVKGSTDMLLDPATTCPIYNVIYYNVTHSQPVLDYWQQNQDLFDEMVHYLGGQNSSFLTVWFMFDVLFVERTNNMSVPQWVEDRWNKLVEFESLYFYTYFSNEEANRLKGGPLLKEWITNINDTVRKEQTKQVFLYSGHDTTLVAVQQALHVYANQTPNYSDAILVELHEIQGEYKVQLLYRHSASNSLSVLTVPGCSDLCPLASFLQLTEDKIPEDIVKECNQVPPDLSTTTPSHQQGLNANPFIWMTTVLLLTALV